MSVKSQESNMRRLAVLLAQDLGCIQGEKECGPNGAKRVFLNVGKAFLRALAKDLGLRDVVTKSNAAGIAVSGSCTLIGMWEDSGIYICMEQPCYDRERVVYYRTVRHTRDYKGGHNHFLTRRDLEKLSYGQLLDKLGALRKDVCHDQTLSKRTVVRLESCGQPQQAAESGLGLDRIVKNSAPRAQAGNARPQNNALFCGLLTI